jgi:hypothetical protein
MRTSVKNRADRTCHSQRDGYHVVGIFSMCDIKARYSMMYPKQSIIHACQNIAVLTCLSLSVLVLNTVPFAVLKRERHISADPPDVRYTSASKLTRFPGRLSTLIWQAIRTSRSPFKCLFHEVVWYAVLLAQCGIIRNMAKTLRAEANLLEWWHC